MKTLIALLISAFALSASASEVSGRAELTLWPDDATGPLTMDIRQEGNKILGMTFFGRSGMVNLEVNSGHYLGFAGGDATTDLTCAEGKCDGVIAGESSNFKTVTKTGRHGEQKLETTGLVRMNPVTVTRTAKSIEINARNSLSLDKVRDGDYEGHAYFYGMNGIRTFRAHLTMDGTLNNVVNDDALMMIFLAAPLNRR